LFIYLFYTIVFLGLPAKRQSVVCILPVPGIIFAQKLRMKQ